MRDTNQEQVNLEYQLSTGQLDNPADLTLATAKASNAAILLMEMRNKALDVYNELMRNKKPEFRLPERASWVWSASLRPSGTYTLSPLTW